MAKVAQQHWASGSLTMGNSSEARSRVSEKKSEMQKRRLPGRLFLCLAESRRLPVGCQIRHRSWRLEQLDVQQRAELRSTLELLAAT